MRLALHSPACLLQWAAVRMDGNAECVFLMRYCDGHDHRAKAHEVVRCCGSLSLRTVNMLQNPRLPHSCTCGLGSQSDNRWRLWVLSNASELSTAKIDGRFQSFPTHMESCEYISSLDTLRIALLVELYDVSKDLPFRTNYFNTSD